MFFEFIGIIICFVIGAIFCVSGLGLLMFVSQFDKGKESMPIGFICLLIGVVMLWLTISHSPIGISFYLN